MQRRETQRCSVFVAVPLPPPPPTPLPLSLFFFFLSLADSIFHRPICTQSECMGLVRTSCGHRLRPGDEGIQKRRIFSFYVIKKFRQVYAGILKLTIFLLRSNCGRVFFFIFFAQPSGFTHTTTHTHIHTHTHTHTHTHGYWVTDACGILPRQNPTLIISGGLPESMRVWR
jgi:hypothetical protein